MKNATIDHRARVTRMLIRKAFMQLLRQRPIEQISIKALCERASINRSTFYAHYTDIYNLLQRIEDEMLSDFEAAMAPLLHVDAGDAGGAVAIKLITGIFQCLKDNADLCTVTLGEYGDKAFAARLIDIGRARSFETYMRHFECVTPQKLEYFYAYTSAGCIGILKKWLVDGMVIPVEEVARMTQHMMIKGMDFLV